jgi:hypothetical protein
MDIATPCSDYIETRGLVFLARMLDKLRLHAAGQIRGGYNSLPVHTDVRFDAGAGAFRRLVRWSVPPYSTKHTTAQRAARMADR